jgi:hypothetical protein
MLTWNDVQTLAKQTGAKYPELVAAQWALESNWGKDTSGKNNFFGIKGTGTKCVTKEFINGKEITITDEFQDFASPLECVKYLVDRWYKNFKSYRGVNNAPDRDSAARDLVRQGYATDPKYAEKLIRLMNENSKPVTDSIVAHFDSNKFLDFVRYADLSNPRHKAAFEDFYSKVDKLDPSLMTDGANWVRIYRTEPKVGEVLNVPYYSQRDNYRDASRTCFSSSCAMLCKFLKPNSIKGDDDYLKYVFSIGDTTDATVQVQTLKHFGISSRFATNLTFSTLDSMLAQGIPVPVGILHHGPSTAPSGGGHWIIVIGKVEDAKAPGGCWYVVNDPWGEIDNSTGTYPSTNGNRVKYSKNLLKSRWTVEGDGTGWGIIASKG